MIDELRIKPEEDQLSSPIRLELQEVVSKALAI